MFGFFKKKNNEAAPEVKQAPEEVTNETIEETELIVEDSQESAKSQIAEEAIEDMSEDIPQDVSEESAAEEPVPEKTTIDESVEEQKTGFFAKLKAGLGKTRNALNEKVDNVLKYFKKIDEDL